MNTDGTNQTNISNNDSDEMYPSWSPDGSKIAFASHKIEGGHIYVMNADGTNQTRLTNNDQLDGTNYAPSWSPDGSKIAFASYIGDNWEIYVIDY